MGPNICQSSLSGLRVVGQTFDLEQIESRSACLWVRGNMGITKGQIPEEGSKIPTFIAIFMASFPMAITLSVENDINREIPSKECVM